MSISGGVRREMNLLAFKWERHITEDSDRLYPGWNLEITLAFVDLRIERIMNRKHFRLYKWGVCMLGYDLDVAKNWENPTKYVYGDASERLLK